MLRPSIHMLLALALLCSFVGRVGAADQNLQQAQVAEPYLELHTGPGRGYPVFHVVAEGEWVSIIKRRTDWFRVRTDRGLKGWVNREQLAQTLDGAGVPRSFRDIVRGHFADAEILFAPDERRQPIVDSWPADVDDSAARNDWGFAPRYDLDSAFSDYLIPGVEKPG